MLEKIENKKKDENTYNSPLIRKNPYFEIQTDGKYSLNEDGIKTFNSDVYRELDIQNNSFTNSVITKFGEKLNHYSNINRNQKKKIQVTQEQFNLIKQEIKAENKNQATKQEIKAENKNQATNKILQIFNDIFKEVNTKKYYYLTPDGMPHLTNEGQNHFLNTVKKQLNIANDSNNADKLIQKMCKELEDLKGDKRKNLKVTNWGTIKTVLTIALSIPLLGIPLVINKIFKGNSLGDTQTKRNINSDIEALISTYQQLPQKDNKIEEIQEPPQIPQKRDNEIEEILNKIQEEERQKANTTPLPPDVVNKVNEELQNIKNLQIEQHTQNHTTKKTQHDKTLPYR